MNLPFTGMVSFPLNEASIRGITISKKIYPITSIKIFHVLQEKTEGFPWKDICSLLSRKTCSQLKKLTLRGYGISCEDIEQLVSSCFVSH